MKRKIPTAKAKQVFGEIWRDEYGRENTLEWEANLDKEPLSKRAQAVKAILAREAQVKRLERKIKGLKTRLARAKRSLAGLIRHHGKPEVKISKR